ncbi:MAG TPA: TolC family protein [Turneriella sp.]|nr:TolC family protein [Turneriella sp.]
MKAKRRYFVFGLFYNLFATVLFSHWCVYPIEAQDIIISEADLIQRMNEVDPNILAAKLRIQEAEGKVKSARAGYFPSLELQALESIPGSFAGSNGLGGVGGVMGSPYHTGFSAGVTATFTIFDFGRTLNASREADAAREGADLQSKITRIERLERALNIFYNTIKFRELGILWVQKGKELSQVAREVGRYIATGQKSVVDRYLIRSRVEEVEREKIEFNNRYNSGLEIIGELLDMKSEKLSLVSLAQLYTSGDMPKIEAWRSPYVLFMQAKKRAAEYSLKRAQAGHMPEVRAYGSAGYMEGARLVPKENWGAGVAFALPLFEGFRVQGEVSAANSKVARVQKELDGAEKSMRATNIRLKKKLRRRANI